MPANRQMPSERSGRLQGIDFSAAEHRTAVVIGTGPAGYTAAIYAARADLEPLVLRGEEPGGQLMTTTEVENYPGFPEGVTGPDLIDTLEAQAKRFGAELRYGRVTDVDFSQRPFRLTIDERTPLLADAVVISTGASAQYLGLPNELRLISRGVSACATCDGVLFRGKEVAVVGGGDSALEEALFLTRFAQKVHVIHRRDKLRASKIMQRRAMNNDKISFIWDSAVEDVLGEDSVTGLRLRNLRSGQASTLTVEGLFVAIGHRPNTEVFRGQVDLDGNGYIRVVPGTSRTSLEGVFASGDVQDPHYRQAITAAGSGAMAALDAERWLAQQNDSAYSLEVAV